MEERQGRRTFPTAATKSLVAGFHGALFRDAIERVFQRIARKGTDICSARWGIIV